MIKYIIAFFLLASTTFGQEISICRVHNPTTNMQGSAVMVHNVKQFENYYLGLAATAAHVVSRTNPDNSYTPIWGPSFNVVHSDNSKVPNISIAEIDTSNDIALIWVSCPNSIPVVRLHNNSHLNKINFGYEQEHKIRAVFQGYGFGVFTTHVGPFSFRYRNDLYSDAIVTPGQSGGAMWIDGELAGIISRGTTDYDSPHGAVWPATCVNVELLPPMIQRALTHVPK